MIVTGHDPDAWPKFQKSPQYYEQGHLACNRACRRIGVGCGRTVSVYSAPDLRASNIEKDSPNPPLEPNENQRPASDLRAAYLW